MVSSIKLNPWYVTGLCDAAASFTYSRGSQSINLYFAIKLSKEDKKLLQGLQKFFFETGKIYNVNSSVYYRVTKLSELEKIVEHFDKYPLRGEKAKSYQIWREMVFLKKKNFRKPSHKQLNDLAKKLSALSPRNQRWDGS